MKRRTIIGLSGSALVALSAVGSGAFSSVRAERTLTIDTTDDANAYLSLDPDDPELDNSSYAVEANGLVEINITEGTETGETSSGNPVFADGVSPFATTTIEEVISVKNQGTQSVEVSVASVGDEFDAESPFEIFATGVPGESEDFRTNLFEQTKDLPVLNPGDSFAAGIEIDATDGELGELEDLLEGLQLTIQAFDVSEADSV